MRLKEIFVFFFQVCVCRRVSPPILLMSADGSQHWRCSCFIHVCHLVTSSGPSWLSRSPEEPWQPWCRWHGGHGSNCTRNHISKISGRIVFIGFSGGSMTLKTFQDKFLDILGVSSCHSHSFLLFILIEYDVMCSFLASSTSTSPWAIWRRCECRKKSLECPTMQRSALRSFKVSMKFNITSPMCPLFCRQG